MANSLSEGFVRQTYASAWGVHHAIFPINFTGTPVAGEEPTLTQKDDGTIAAITGYAAFMAKFKAMFNGATQFGLAECYAVDPDTDERTFIYGWDVALTGSASPGNVRLGMATFSFKTIGGGALRVVCMEGVSLVNQKLRPPYEVDSAHALLSAYVVGDDSILIGRDNTYAFAPISLTIKTSDVLRKRDGI